MNLTTAIVLFVWFVILCGAVVAVQTAIRKGVHFFKPQWEGNNIYKGILALGSLALGVPVALCGNCGVPWVLALVGVEAIVIPWPFAVIIGVVVGMSSAFVWQLVKSYMKRKLSLNSDVEK